jgi:phenylacetaldehyde dehydrogenase
VPFKGDDLNDVAALANDTPYGLAASIFTRDLSNAHRLARRIDAGLIEINGGAPMQFALPYGGFKQSGLGRENGREGVESFTEIKTVSVRLA